jgi:hypothetical protein
MVEMGSAYTILVRKPEVKKPIGILRCVWENTFKMDLKEVGVRVWV